MTRKPLISAVCGYLLLLIVFPVGSIFAQAWDHGFGGFIHELASPIGLASIRLSLETSILATIINTMMGTVIAFVFARFPLPGKGLLNAIVDVPFAMPTTVTGLMFLTLYAPNSLIGSTFLAHGFRLLYSQPGIVLVMIFVTFPYTVRAVQPLFEGMEGDMEEAAKTLGASKARILHEVVLPVLMPGILTGFGLTFSRALAEFGSVVMVSGNIPMKTELAPVYLYGLLESDDLHGAAVISVTLVLISSIVLIAETYLSHKRLRLSRWRTPGRSKSGIERRIIREGTDWTI